MPSGNGNSLLSSLAAGRQTPQIPSQMNGGGMPMNNPVNQNSLANVNLQNRTQMSPIQSDTRLMSSMTSVMEGMSRNITNAINSQTQQLMQGFGGVAQAISQGFQGIGELLQQLFSDRASLIAESENISKAMEKYSRYTTNFFTTLFEKKYNSLLQEVKAPLKGWEDVQEKLVNFMGSSETIAHLLELTPLSKVKNPTELAPFTKDLAESIKVSGDSLKSIDIYQNDMYQRLEVLSKDVFIPQYKSVRQIESYSAKTTEQLLNIYKVLYNIYQAGYSKQVKDERKRQKEELRKTNESIKLLEDRRRSGGLNHGDQRQLDALQKKKSNIKENLSNVGNIIPISKVDTMHSRNMSILSKNDLNVFKDLTGSITKLTEKTNENLQALKDNTSEIKNQGSFTEVLSTFGLSLLNPSTWIKLLTGPIGKMGMYYSLYKFADAGVQWMRPKIVNASSTFIPGTNDRTIGSVFSAGKSTVSQYLIDPLLTGLKSVFKWVLGDEWFNKISGYISTIKTYTVDVAHALFGDPGQKEEARSKLGKIIYDKVYDAIKAVTPIILKGIMVYRGTKALLNPMSLVNAFKDISNFQIFSGLKDRNANKALYNAIQRKNIDAALESYSEHNNVSLSDISYDGKNAYVTKKLNGILGRLGLTRKEKITHILKDAKNVSFSDYLEGKEILTGDDGELHYIKSGKRVLDADRDKMMAQWESSKPFKFKESKLGQRLINTKDAIYSSLTKSSFGKWILNVGSSFKKGIGGLFGKIAGGLGKILRPIGSVFRGALGLVSGSFKALLGPVGLVISAFSALSFYANVIAKFAKREGGTVTGGIKKFIGNTLSNMIGNIGDTIKGGIQLLPDILGGFFSGVWTFLKREGPELGRTIFWDLPKKILEVGWELIKWLGNKFVWVGQWLAYKITHAIPLIPDSWKYTPDWAQTSGYVLGEKLQIDKASKHGEKEDNMAFIAHNDKLYGDIMNAMSDATKNFNKKKKDEEEGNEQVPFAKTLLGRTLQNIRDQSGDIVGMYRGGKGIYKMFEDAYNSNDPTKWKEAQDKLDKLRTQEFSIDRNDIDELLKQNGLSLRYLLETNPDIEKMSKQDALKEIMKIASSAKFIDTIRKPLQDQLNKEEKARLKQEQDERNKRIGEEAEKMKQEQRTASIGTLAQWFNSGAAKKFIQDSITSLGEKIKAGWEFLKKQDYKKMFGDAMEVFGGVSGNIISTIFGEDKANAWVDNAMKYAEANNKTYAKKFLSGAKNSLTKNVEQIAQDVRDIKNGNVAAPGSVAAGGAGASLSGLTGGSASTPSGSYGRFSSEEYKKYLDANKTVSNDKLKTVVSSIDGYKLKDSETALKLSKYNQALQGSDKGWASGARGTLLNFLKNTHVSMYDSSGNTQVPTTISDMVLIGSNMTKTVEGTGTNKNDGKLGWSRVGIYAVKLPMYYNDMGPAMKKLMKTEYYDKFYNGNIHTHQETDLTGPKATALKAILNGGLGNKPDQDPRFAGVYINDVNLHTKVFERYFKPFKDIPFPVNVLLADHAYQYGFGDTSGKRGSGFISTITRAARALGAKGISNLDKVNSLKVLKLNAEQNPWYTGSVLLSSMFKRSITNKSENIVGIAARVKKLAGMLGYIRDGEVFNHPYIEKTPFISSSNTENKSKPQTPEPGQVNQYNNNQTSKAENNPSTTVVKSPEKVLAQKKQTTSLQSSKLQAPLPEDYLRVKTPDLSTDDYLHVKSSGQATLDPTKELLDMGLDNSLSTGLEFLNKVNSGKSPVDLHAWLVDTGKKLGLSGEKLTKFVNDRFEKFNNSKFMTQRRESKLLQENAKSSAITSVENLYNSDKFNRNIVLPGSEFIRGSKNPSKYIEIINKLNARKITAEKAKEFLTAKDLTEAQKGDLKEYIDILTQLLGIVVADHGKNDERSIQLTNVITQLSKKQTSNNTISGGIGRVVKGLGRAAAKFMRK